MKHLRKRVTKIVDDLMAYLFSMGANDITINFKEEEKQFKIYVKSNYNQNEQEKIKDLIKYLKMEKQEEMEEYYWELTGDSIFDPELSLIGMMTDKKEINVEDDFLEIVLYRYK